LWDFIALMQKHQLTWEEKTQGQLFCVQKAGAIVKMLLDECQKYKVDIKLNQQISRIEKGFKVISSDQVYQSKSLIVATGGSAVPQMGASDFALSVAKQFGIKTMPFTPALTPLVFQNHCFQALSGVSFEAIVRCKKVAFRESVLITHKGLSGPAILQISSYWQQGELIYLDIFPDVCVEKWLLSAQQNQANLQVKTILAQKLPNKLAEKLVVVASQLQGKTLGEISKKELIDFGKKLNNFEVLPTMKAGFKKAEASRYGVDTAEISSQTMQCQQVKNLYFLGEAVDVLGWLGGYNFAWAWASGFVAGQQA
jgi:predicted Rossmann fold flavoprotein